MRNPSETHGVKKRNKRQLPKYNTHVIAPIRIPQETYDVVIARLTSLGFTDIETPCHPDANHGVFYAVFKGKRILLGMYDVLLALTDTQLKALAREEVKAQVASLRVIEQPLSAIERALYMGEGKATYNVVPRPRIQDPKPILLGPTRLKKRGGVFGELKRWMNQ